MRDRTSQHEKKRDAGGNKVARKPNENGKGKRKPADIQLAVAVWNWDPKEMAAGVITRYRHGE